MRALLLISICGLVCSAGMLQAQIGHNCPGEHPNLLRDASGHQEWLGPERLNQMAIKKVMPIPPQVPLGVVYDSYVTIKILVNKQGEVDCIWDNTGNSIFFPAADEAGRWWKFKPLVVNGKPMEFTGVLGFHLTAGR